MVGLNQRVSESRKQLEGMPVEAITALCNYLTEELGSPTNDVEQEALEYLEAGNYDTAKRFCLFDPCNSYLAAISCIASAYRSPMVADSVLRDAARHTAEVAKQKAEIRIAQHFQQILK